MIIYRWEFFRTREAAQAYKKAKGYGCYLSYKYNRREFIDYLIMAGENLEYAGKYPYLIAWNEEIEA